MNLPTGEPIGGPNATHTYLPPEGEPPVHSGELVVPRLIAKWREHAKEAACDLGSAIDCESRTRLATESRILERCARQLERGLARHNVEVSGGEPLTHDKTKADTRHPLD